MKNIVVGKQVTAHNGTASVGGMFINEIFLSGKVTTVNAKSIRVQLNHERRTQNGKETYAGDYSENVSFKFWKTLSNGDDCYTANIGCSRYLIRV